MARGCGRRQPAPGAIASSLLNTSSQKIAAGGRNQDRDGDPEMYGGLPTGVARLFRIEVNK